MAFYHSKPHHPISYHAYWYWGSPWPYQWRKKTTTTTEAAFQEPKFDQTEEAAPPEIEVKYSAEHSSMPLESSALDPEVKTPKEECSVASTEPEPPPIDEDSEQPEMVEKRPPTTGTLRWRFPQ